MQIFDKSKLDKYGLSIVIPVYNEADNVIELYQEIKMVFMYKLVNLSKYEIIFVNDGSNDSTDAQLKFLIKTEPNICVVTHQFNYGQSAALLSGVKAANFSLIITMDGDGQNNPADLPLLLNAFQDGNTVILGNRIHREDNFLRRLASQVANKIRAFWLKDGCKDTGCSLKLFTREAFLRLPYFNHIHRFLPALFKAAGLTVINLPVTRRLRRHGYSKYGIKDRLFIGIYDLIGVRWLLARFNIIKVINQIYSQEKYNNAENYSSDKTCS